MLNSHCAGTKSFTSHFLTSSFLLNKGLHHVCPRHNVLSLSQNKPMSGTGLCCDGYYLEAREKADEPSPY